MNKSKRNIAHYTQVIMSAKDSGEDFEGIVSDVLYKVYDVGARSKSEVYTTISQAMTNRESLELYVFIIEWLYLNDGTFPSAEDWRAGFIMSLKERLEINE